MSSLIAGKIPFIGDKVKIVPKDDFFGYCADWHGVIEGLNSGLFEVHCEREDGVKTLFVPGDQLAFVD